MTNQSTKVFNGSNVRILEINGEFWFVAKDVCEVLEIKNSRDAVSKLKDTQKHDVGVSDAIGRTQMTTAINEAGVYKLVFRSNKPEVEKFSDWVSEEVLPSIRKTGSYQTPTLPDTHVKAVEMYLGQLKLEYAP